MKKYTDLIKNFGYLIISSFGSKILAFFLVPLYTSILTTEEYGNYDFINTTVSLLIPLLTIDISDGALRFLLDKKSNKKNIISYTFFIVFLSIIVVGIALIINHKFNLIKIIDNYFLFFILFYISNIVYTTMQNIARGLDKLRAIAIVGFINSILVLILNILLLLVFKKGLEGYFIAYILSNLVSGLILFALCKTYNYFSIKNRDVSLESRIRKYSFPLMFNSIGWWINNVSDRYMVTYMIGVSANGLYSMAYKIPSLLSIIQSVFNQAWTISAVKSFDDSKKEEYYNNIYSIYNFILVFGSSLLIVFTKVFAYFLYKNEFYNAWVYMPPLILANLFGALSGVLGGIFAATKDSKTMGRTTIIGAILNIIINFILIRRIGAMGAAIGSFVSFFIVWLVRYIKISNKIKLSNNIFIDIFCYVTLIIQSSSLLLFKNNLHVLYIINTVLVFIIVLLNINLIKNNKNKILNFIKRKEKNNE